MVIIKNIYKYQLTGSRKVAYIGDLNSKLVRYSDHASMSVFPHKYDDNIHKRI